MSINGRGGCGGSRSDPDESGAGSSTGPAKKGLKSSRSQQPSGRKCGLRRKKTSMLSNKSMALRASEATAAASLLSGVSTPFVPISDVCLVIGYEPERRRLFRRGAKKIRVKQQTLICMNTNYMLYVATQPPMQCL
jgi:hypothetical protein